MRILSSAPKLFGFLVPLVICFLALLVAPSDSFTPPNQPQYQQRVVMLCGSAKDRNILDNSPIVIALTREEGKNDKLRDKLTQQLSNQPHDIEIVELPCIAHADGPDHNKLEETLNGQSWDYVTITSPEAARVLASAWNNEKLSYPPPSVAAVGKATQDALAKFGIPVDFCPSKAYAKVLVEEIPMKSNLTTVLYPASAKAQDTLQSGLVERGFSVTRLNTYDTVTATWTAEQKQKAKQTKIVCVASPSSIKGWLKNNNSEAGIEHILAACIGETSAEACRKLGFREDQIFYPEKPGIVGWADSVQEAVQSISHPSVTAS